MKYFKITLEGHGYFLTLSEKKESIGFYTTFIIAGKSLEETKSIVAKKLIARLTENGIGTASNYFSPSYSTIEAIYLLEKNEITLTADGFSFYRTNLLRKIKSHVTLIYLKIFSSGRLIIHTKKEM